MPAIKTETLTIRLCPATKVALCERGWLHEQGMLKREVSAGTIEIVAGKARRSCWLSLR